jgi:hypothetical protein
MIRRIAFSGKQGSGKTLCAQYLMKHYNFHHVGFADAIKDYAMNQYSLSYEQVYGRHKNRELLQRIGSDFRSRDPNFWVDIAMTKLDRLKVPVVIDDLRYPNEYKALTERGFYLVRMEAMQSLRRQRLSLSFKNPEHSSETSLDDIVGWNNVITNNNEKQEVYDVLDRIMEKGK